MLIEASSELETLSDRNRSFKDMLEAKRREVDVVAKESDRVQATAKKLLDECKEIMASDDAEQREFLTTMPEGQTVDQLKQKVANLEHQLGEMQHGIDELRQKWEPELDRLVGKISDAFSYSFKQINCAGEVGIHKDEDFDQWSIQIQVKFRFVPSIFSPSCFRLPFLALISSVSSFKPR